MNAQVYFLNTKHLIRTSSSFVFAIRVSALGKKTKQNKTKGIVLYF